MNASQPSEFHDPLLQQAVQSAWGSEKAPAGLTDRCRAAMKSIDSAQISPAPLRLLQPTTATQPVTNAKNSLRASLPRWGGWAIAAAVLLFIGVTGSLFYKNLSSLGGEKATIAGGIPVSFIQDVIGTHDYCSTYKMEQHHNVNCPKDDFWQIKQQLEAELGYPIWSTPVAGWEFCGASRCYAGADRQQCSHLLFCKPDHKQQTLSVISIAYNDPNTLKADEMFAEQIQHHPVVGFIEGKQMYCLVGHDPDDALSLDELRAAAKTYRHNLHDQLPIATQPLFIQPSHEPNAPPVHLAASSIATH
ncbi:MAG: hypothetical protein IT448_08445 [Phycisphaerales bacterium]|nr:hypothetical protein [Phycisphaerales bacterium]